MSPDDLGFDEIDHELGRALRLSAPESHDAESTLESLRPRLTRARRRRVAGVTAGWGAIAAGIVALAITVVPGAERSVRTRPAHRPDSATTTAPSDASTTSTTRGTTEPSIFPTTTIVEPGDDHGGGGSNSGPGGGGGDDGTSGSGSPNSGTGSSESGSSGSGSSGSGSGGGTDGIPD